MNENLKAILEKLKQDPELLAKIKEEVTNNPPKSKEEILELAKKHGLKLTEADLSFSKDLTEEELKQAAGGKSRVSTSSPEESAAVIKEHCGDAVWGICSFGAALAFPVYTKTC